MAGSPIGSASELASLGQYAFILTAFLTVMGWLFIARQNTLKEQRSDIKGHIDDIRRHCAKALESCANYWLGPDGIPQGLAGATLKSEIETVNRLCEIIRSAGLTSETLELVVDIRSLATGGDFEVKSRARQKDNDAMRVSDVGFAIEQLLFQIEVDYYRQFPVKNSELALVSLVFIAATLVLFVLTILGR